METQSENKSNNSDSREESRRGSIATLATLQLESETEKGDAVVVTNEGEGVIVTTNENGGGNTDAGAKSSSSSVDPVKKEQKLKEKRTAKVPEAPKKGKRSLGIFLAGFAALMYSVSALLIKILHYHAFNLGFWRSAVMIVVTLPFLIHGQFCRKLPKDDESEAGETDVPPEPDRKGILEQVWPLNKTSAYLLLQAIIGANSILFVFFGLSYLNIGDSIVIGTSAPVFVSVVSWIILRERFSWVSITLAIASMIGVGIICKPPIFTGGVPLDADTIKGVCFSSMSMLLLTFSYVIIRYLRKVHHALIQFSFALWGLLECGILAWLTGIFDVPTEWKTIGMIVASALFAFFAQTCITMSLKYEQAGVVALVRTSEVIFAYFWQTVFLHAQPDLLSIIGAVITLSCVAIATLRNILLSLDEGDKRRKFFKLLLK